MGMESTSRSFRGAVDSSECTSLQMEAALIDVVDPTQPNNANSSSLPVIPPSTTEQSRWPGAEARLSLLHPINDSAAHRRASAVSSRRIEPQTEQASIRGQAPWIFIFQSSLTST